MPKFVYSDDYGKVVIIRRHVDGYFPVTTNETADTLNARLSPVPTAAQITAMKMGCMFGWHVPGANPAAHAPQAAPTPAAPSMKHLATWLAVAVILIPCLLILFVGMVLVQGHENEAL